MTSPIAFILWHCPQADAAPKVYETGLKTFHASLKASRPEGFMMSESLRFVRLPWLATESAAYQDWYLVTDFAAMGILNDAAVAGARRTPHDEVATHASEGVGGVYAVETGDPFATGNSVFHWLRKPPARVTEDYLQAVREIAARADASLWRRQMNLGVAPEYCLRSAVELDVPGLEQVLPVDHRVWPD